MRFNSQEFKGRRARLRYSVELNFDITGLAEFLCNVHAAQTPRIEIAADNDPMNGFILPQPTDLAVSTAD